MKQLFETFLGAFFLFLLVVCSMSCLMAAVEARNADKYKTEYIAQMENGDFAKNVVETVFEDAAEQGFDIELTFYKDLNGTMTVSAPIKTAADFLKPEAEGGLSGDTRGTYMVKLKLGFDYSFPLMSSITKHTLMGYAV